MDDTSDMEIGIADRDSTLLYFGSLLFRSGKLLAAEKVFREFYKKFPNDFRSNFNLGMILIELDKLNEGISFLETSLHIDPCVKEAYHSLANAYIKDNNPQLALRMCLKCLSLYDNDRTSLYNLNVALRQLNRQSEAIDFSWRFLTTNLNVKYPNIYHEIQHYDINASNYQLTIIVIKWGTKYNSDYVNNLYISCLENLQSAVASLFRFICVTENPLELHPNIEVKALPDLGWEGWWYKAYIFAPELQLQGTIIYLDLDTVICGSLDWLAFVVDQFYRYTYNTTLPSINTSSTTTLPSVNTSSTTGNQMQTIPVFVTLSAGQFVTEGRPEGINSSIIIWRDIDRGSSSKSRDSDSNSAASDTSIYSELYFYLVQNYLELRKVIYKFDHYLEMMLLRNGRTAKPTGSQITGESDIPNSGYNNFSTNDSNEIEYPCSSSSSSSSSIIHVCYLHTLFPFFVRCYSPSLVINEINHFEENEEVGVNELPDHDPTNEKSSEDKKKKHFQIEEDCRILCFPLKPKPHELLELVWIQSLWVH